MEERERERKDLISEVEEILSSNIELSDILNQIMKTVACGLKSEVASLFLLDEETGELKIEASYGLPEEIVKNARAKIGDRSITGWVAKTGQPLILNGEVKNSQFNGVNPKIKSAISVPLKIGNETLGVLNVSNREKNVIFNEDDLQLLLSIANHSAAVVKSLKLQKLLFSRTKKLKILHQISSLANSLLDSKQLLSKITQITTELLLSDGGFSVLKKDEGIIPISEYIIEPLPKRLDKEYMEKLCKKVMERKDTLYLTPDSDHIIADFLREEEISCMLCRGLESKGKILGGIAIFRGKEKKRYSEEEVLFFNTICEIVGSALSNALLYENLLEKHSQLEKAYRNLYSYEKLVTLAELASGIAHEINNPLTVISALVDMAEMKIEKPEEVIKKIKEEVKRTFRIITGLKRLSQQKPSVQKLIDVNEILEDTILLLKPKLLSQKVEIEKVLQEDLPKIYGDEVQIEEIFINLLNNAIEALEKVRRIRVETKCDGENVIIKISDTGKGIPPEIINDIFKPFYTTKPDGSGIGLSLVKEFVKANSGKIDVKSEVNKGTEFTITFPVPHNL